MLATHIPTSHEELVQYLESLGPKSSQNQRCLWGYRDILLDAKKIQAIHKDQFTNTSPFEIYKTEFLALPKYFLKTFTQE